MPPIPWEKMIKGNCAPAWATGACCSQAQPQLKKGLKKRQRSSQICRSVRGLGACCSRGLSTAVYVIVRRVLNTAKQGTNARPTGKGQPCKPAPVVFKLYTEYCEAISRPAQLQRAESADSTRQCMICRPSSIWVHAVQVIAIQRGVL